MDGNNIRAPNGALARGLAVLDVIVEAHHPLSHADIARQTALDLSTLTRILKSLEQARHIIRVDGGKRFAASPRAMLPLPPLHPLQRFRAEVFPLLKQSTDFLKLTISLIIYVEDERLTLDIVLSPYSSVPFYRAWSKGDYHSTAAGKAFLLAVPPSRRPQLLGPGPYQGHTEKTITEPAVLMAELEKADERGYVIARDEVAVGITGIAANIPTWGTSPLGSLLVAYNNRETPDDRAEFVGKHLVETARLIRLHTTSIDGLMSYLGKPVFNGLRAGSA